MSWVQATLAAVACSTTGLTVYCSGAGLLPFLLGLHSLRVHATNETLRIVGIDAEAMHATGFILFGGGPLLLAFGKDVAVVGALVALLFWAGLRVRIETDGARTLVSRRLFWIIPWHHRRHPLPLDAWTDGWGDFADPEAFHVSAGDDALELGWSYQGSHGRAEELVETITRWTAVHAAVATRRR